MGHCIVFVYLYILCLLFLLFFLQEGHLQVINYLAKLGVDVNANDIKGRTGKDKLFNMSLELRH